MPGHQPFVHASSLRGHTAIRGWRAIHHEYLMHSDVNSSQPQKMNGDRPLSPPPPSDNFGDEVDVEEEVRDVHAEAWADVKKTESVTKMFSEMANSPAVAKLIDMLASRQHAQARQTTRVRVALVRAQERNARRGNVFVCIALVLCLSFLGVVIYWLKADKDTLLPVLSALIGLIAGAGGGYVFGRQSINGRSE